MTVDFGILARLEERLDRIERQLPDLVEAAVRKVLDARDDDQIGGLAKLATWCSAPTADAMRKRLNADRELAGLALPGKHRRWRKSEVVALMVARRTEGQP